MMNDRIEDRGLKNESNPPRRACHAPTRSSLLIELLARVGRNKQSALRRTESLHAAQCPLVIAPYQSYPSVLSPRPSIRGFSLISAIFLLVVIAALGTFAVTLSTIQHQSSALDVMGARAYQAARAGIEWGAYQVLRNGGGCAAATASPLPAMPGTLAGFTVTITCNSSTPTETGATINMYQITSTAKQGTVATASYVERQMSVTIAK